MVPIFIIKVGAHSGQPMTRLSGRQIVSTDRQSAIMIGLRLRPTACVFSAIGSIQRPTHGLKSVDGQTTARHNGRHTISTERRSEITIDVTARALHVGEPVNPHRSGTRAKLPVLARSRDRGYRSKFRDNNRQFIDKAVPGVCVEIKTSVFDTPQIQR